MLYKKIHRQYLREFRVGRKFMLRNEIFEIIKEVIKKPYISRNRIWIDTSSTNRQMELIRLRLHFSGWRWYKEEITWLD